MSLDLSELTADWDCPTGEVSARHVKGRDGRELLQLRVDLGVLQMFPDGRPDGARYHGMPSVQEYVRRELRAGRKPANTDWQELQRELQQLNYRRLALASLAQAAVKRHDKQEGRGQLIRALRDIDTCLQILSVMSEHRGLTGSDAALIPTLVFNRARLAIQLRVVMGQYDEAIDEADAGIRDLDDVLAQSGLDPEQRQCDPGIDFLRKMERDLRREHGIEFTVREQLDDAIEREDFEAAARLRERLRQREQSGQPRLPCPEEG